MFVHFYFLRYFKWYRSCIGGAWVNKAYFTGKVRWDIEMENDKYKIIGINTFPDSILNTKPIGWRELVAIKHQADASKITKEGHWHTKNDKLICSCHGIDFLNDSETVINNKLS